MGQQSQAIQACLKNLQKHVTTPQKAYIEDVMDGEDADYNHTKQHGMADLLEEGFFFLDEDSDSDEGSEYGEEDIDEEELAGLKTEDDIHCFNAILAEAQAVAVQASKEAAESKPKRKRHYCYVWVRMGPNFRNESGVSRDLASAYVLCLRTFVVPNLRRDKGKSLGKKE